MTTNRTIYAIPHTPYSGRLDAEGEPDIGKYSALFEEISNSSGERLVKAINEVNFFDDPALVFIHNGYSKIQRREPYGLVKFHVKESENYKENTDQTRFIGSADFYDKLSQDKVVSFIHAKLPEPGFPRVVLPYAPLTKYIYIVDDNTAYGPFIYERSKDEAIGLAYFIELPEISSITQKLAMGTIFKFEYSLAIDLGTISKSGSYSLAYEVNSLLNLVHAEPFEYLTPRVLNSILKDVLKSAGGKGKANQFMPVVNALDTSRNKRLSFKIKESIKAQLDGIDSGWSTELRSQIFDIISQDENGSMYLESAMSSRKEEFDTRWIKSVKAENTELLDAIERSKNERGKVETEVADKHRELAKVIQTIQDKVTELESDAYVKSITDEKELKLDELLSERTKELKEIEALLEAHKSLEKINKEIESQEAVHTYYNKKTEGLESTLRTVTDQLRESEVELQRKLREIAPTVSALIQAPILSLSIHMK